MNINPPKKVRKITQKPKSAPRNYEITKHFNPVIEFSSKSEIPEVNLQQSKDDIKPKNFPKRKPPVLKTIIAPKITKKEKSKTPQIINARCLKPQPKSSSSSSVDTKLDKFSDKARFKSKSFYSSQPSPTKKLNNSKTTLDKTSSSSKTSSLKSATDPVLLRNQQHAMLLKKEIANHKQQSINKYNKNLEGDDTHIRSLKNEISEGKSKDVNNKRALITELKTELAEYKRFNTFQVYSQRQLAASKNKIPEKQVVEAGTSAGSMRNFNIPETPSCCVPESLKKPGKKETSGIVFNDVSSFESSNERDSSTDENKKDLFKSKSHSRNQLFEDDVIKGKIQEANVLISRVKKALGRIRTIKPVNAEANTSSTTPNTSSSTDIENTIKKLKKQADELVKGTDSIKPHPDYTESEDKLPATPSTTVESEEEYHIDVCITPDKLKKTPTSVGRAGDCGSVPDFETRPRTRRNEAEDELIEEYGLSRYRSAPEVGQTDITSSFEVLQEKLRTISEATESATSGISTPKIQPSEALPVKKQYNCCGCNTDPLEQATKTVQACPKTAEIGVGVGMPCQGKCDFQMNFGSHLKTLSQSTQMLNSVAPKAKCLQSKHFGSQTVAMPNKKPKSCQKKTLPVQEIPPAEQKNTYAKNCNKIGLKEEHQNCVCLDSTLKKPKKPNLTVQRLPPVILHPALTKMMILNFSIYPQGNTENRMQNTENVCFLELDHSKLNILDSKHTKISVPQTQSSDKQPLSHSDSKLYSKSKDTTRNEHDPIREMMLRSFLIYDNPNRHLPDPLNHTSREKLSAIDVSVYKTYINPEGLKKHPRGKRNVDESKTVEDDYSYGFFGAADSPNKFSIFKAGQLEPRANQSKIGQESKTSQKGALTYQQEPERSQQEAFKYQPEPGTYQQGSKTSQQEAKMYQKESKIYQQKFTRSQEAPDAYQQRSKTSQQEAKMYQPEQKACQQECKMYQQEFTTSQEAPDAHQQRSKTSQQEAKMYQPEPEAYQQESKMYQQEFIRSQEVPGAYQQRSKTSQQEAKMYQQESKIYQQKFTRYQEAPKAHQQGSKMSQQEAKMYQPEQETYQQESKMYQQEFTRSQEAPDAYQQRSKTSQQGKMYQLEPETYQQESTRSQEAPDAYQQRSKTSQQPKFYQTEPEAYQQESKIYQQESTRSQEVSDAYQQRSQTSQQEAKMYQTEPEAYQQESTRSQEVPDAYQQRSNTSQQEAKMYQTEPEAYQQESKIYQQESTRSQEAPDAYQQRSKTSQEVKMHQTEPEAYQQESKMYQQESTSSQEAPDAYQQRSKTSQQAEMYQTEPEAYQQESKIYQQESTRSQEAPDAYQKGSKSSQQEAKMYQQEPKASRVNFDESRNRIEEVGRVISEPRASDEKSQFWIDDAALRISIMLPPVKPLSTIKCAIENLQGLSSVAHLPKDEHVTSMSTVSVPGEISGMNTRFTILPPRDHTASSVQLIVKESSGFIAKMMDDASDKALQVISQKSASEPTVQKAVSYKDEETIHSTGDILKTVLSSKPVSLSVTSSRIIKAKATLTDSVKNPTGSESKKTISSEIVQPSRITESEVLSQIYSDTDSQFPEVSEPLVPEREVSQEQKESTDYISTPSEITVTISYTDSNESAMVEMDKRSKDKSDTDPKKFLPATVSVGNEGKLGAGTKKLAPKNMSPISRVQEKLKTLDTSLSVPVLNIPPSKESEGTLQNFIKGLTLVTTDSNTTGQSQNLDVKSSKNDKNVNYCFVEGPSSPPLSLQFSPLQLAKNGRYKDEENLFAPTISLLPTPSQQTYTKHDTHSIRDKEIQRLRLLAIARNRLRRFSPDTSNSDTITTNSLSEGEIRCKHSVSNGELHLCNTRPIKSVRLKRNILTNKYDLLSSRKWRHFDFCDPTVTIEERRNHFNNWVTYYIKQQERINDSSNSSYSNNK
ncbi:uncharacterized protein LOC115874530 [Sitophilus oryzae]|uniref:Uncharacterized protein LOC115874530 n=1 Tax=Sitophilus oryzae TaxID=7048 RepID=A0A6J2X3P0_SITOR|nr:uncharacterized protein LOC115874530 [Sitophilus oryzae]